MKLNPLSFLICLCLFWCGENLFSQTHQNHSPENMEKLIRQANDFIISFENDSAHLLLDSLIEELEANNQFDSHWGLRARLAKAAIYQHDGKDSLALSILLETQEKSREKEEWETLATTHLVLAELYENISQEEKARNSLRQANPIIITHQLDSLYPSYAIRMASWHRVFKRDLDSTRYYTMEVLRTAPNFDQPLNLALGFMFMGMLTKDDYEQAASYFTQAARLYRHIEDYSGESFMFHNIVLAYTENEKYDLALPYNDSAVVAINKAVDSDRYKPISIFISYKHRGDIFGGLNNLDSALFYTKKGYELELEHSKTLELNKIVEIEARYNDEKKNRQIEEQAQEINYSKQRRNALLLFIGLILFFSLIVTYYAVKLRHSNRRNKEKAEQLKNLDIAKSRFFANVSHELRTPITLINGPIQSLLKENQLSEKQEKLLTMARNSGNRLLQLVNDILNLRKLEMGHLKVQNQATSLKLFFTQYTAQFESLAYSKQVDYSYDIQIDGKIEANIDQEKCRQILDNLISNAFKYTRPEGNINSIISLKKDRLSIEVSDSGIGIHPIDLPNVFDRFYQTKRVDKPAEGGTGIGLSLCKQYVELFGGTVKVKSKLGEGSVFKVEFPVELVEVNQERVHSLTILENLPEQHFLPRQSENTPESVTKEKPTVLVVEDNPELQDYIKMILSEKYHVLTADNGQIALERLPSIPKCNLVLSDLMMPIMDGYQLLERLKSEDATRHIPVIMLTARADAKDRLKALRIGVDDYLTKPFIEEELLVRIENLLQNQAIRTSVQNDVPELLNSDEPLVSILDREWLEKFEHYIGKYYANETLSVPGLAEEFAMSESTLLRQLKRLTGLTPIQYLQEIRLNKARELLENQTYQSIYEIAIAVGYKDGRSFSRGFKKRFGKLPSIYSGLISNPLNADKST